jgi:hypothetical protein
MLFTVTEVYERGISQPRLGGDPILGRAPVGPNLMHDSSNQNWTEEGLSVKSNIVLYSLWILIVDVVEFLCNV